MDNDRFQEPSNESLEVGYETSRVSIKGLAVFLVCLILFAAGLLAGSWSLFKGYLRSDQKQDRSQSALMDSEFMQQYDRSTGAALGPNREALPPSPRLQPTPKAIPQNVPSADLEQMYRKEDRVFRQMGWVIDEQTHVPLHSPAAVVASVIRDEAVESVRK